MKFVSLIILFFVIASSVQAKEPATEIRAAWLTTNWGLDWPTQGTSVRAQKDELKRILDQLQGDNFNTVLFQVRAQGCVFYKSKIEPLSPFFNHADGFDPLAFAIEECHKRGMECHAWLITYPMGKAEFTTIGKSRKKKVLVDNKPDYYKLVDDRWYLDPGRPETKQRLLGLVTEIVRNYDVDGIHFDYIRYPSNTRQFPDADTYQKYGRGMSLNDWRRENINSLVASVYDTVKSLKNWVQVSSSPLGRYKVLPEVSRNDGWTAYETVFQDAGEWMRSGKHDLVFPMMYYRNKMFFPFLDDWVANSNGRLVVPGLGVYQMDEQNWDIEDITKQLSYTRNNNIKGQAYFRTGNVINNLKGVRDSIGVYYRYPAKLPPLVWLNKDVPQSPIDLEIYKKDENLHIEWAAPEINKQYTYTIYVSTTKDVDTNDASNILATGVHGNSFSFPVSIGEFGYYYTITASDRYHTESTICFPGYFSHSSNPQ